MPKKIRELIRTLKKAGFVDRSGKGSHRNFSHACGSKITLSGTLRMTRSGIKNEM